jgi:O-antigen ligase
MQSIVLTQKKIFIWIDTLIRWSIYGLFFSFPLGNAPVEIFAGIACVAFLLELALSFFLPRSERKNTFALKEIISDPVSITILCFWVWCSVSVFFSIDVGGSLRALFTKVGQNVILYFCCALHLREKKHIKKVLVFLFVSAGLTCINGIVQWFTDYDFIRGRSIYTYQFERRIRGAFNHPNNFGAYVAIVATIVASMNTFILRKDKGYQRRAGLCLASRGTILFQCLGWAFFLIALVSLLIFSFSRAAILGLLMSTLLLMLNGKRVFISGVLTVFFVLTLSLFFVPDGRMIMDNMGRKMDRISRGSSVSEYTRNAIRYLGNGRELFWRDALSLINKKPYVGSGLNAYTKALNTLPDASRKGWYAHNCYFQLCVELGSIGLAFFLAIFGTFFCRFFLWIRSDIDEWLSAVVWGLASAVFCICIIAFFDNFMFTVQLGFIHWIFMGIVVTLMRGEKR